MNKRTKGEILTTIGSPPAIGVMAFYGSLRDNPLHWLWCVPLTIVTLPLLPLYLQGEKILQECDKEDFTKATSHLPAIHLPMDYYWIDGSDESKFWTVGPAYEEEFQTQEECRKWLVQNGYQEVVALNYPNSLDTYWIK